MHRNSYDSDNSTISPQGRLHQVEYALEAVKQGSASVGLRSKTHVVLLALKRSTGELASYQKKLIRIDDHIGIAIAGLTSDARVLSNFMRTQAMSSRMLYNRPLPVNRIVNAIADKAQTNTQHYGKRPYGVGFLVAGHDEQGPHLYEFSPSGNTFEYYAMSIGARSQSAKTYLEAHLHEFDDCDLPTLIKHGLHALRDTLQQDKELTPLNTSLGIVGLTPPSSASDTKPEILKTEDGSTPMTLGAVSAPGFDKFRIIEGDGLRVFLDSMDVKETPESTLQREATAARATADASAAALVAGAAPVAPAGAGGDAMETD